MAVLEQRPRSLELRACDAFVEEWNIGTVQYLQSSASGGGTSNASAQRKEKPSAVCETEGTQGLADI